MNTLAFQSSATPRDYHFHICWNCFTVFSHQKSLIPPGLSFAAHDCPECDLPVNDRLDEWNGPVDFEHYYGRS